MRLLWSSGSSLCAFTNYTLRLLFIGLMAALPLWAQTGTSSLVLTPGRLRFGTVQVGDSEVQVVAVTNVGDSRAAISAIKVSGSEFSIGGQKMPVALEAGGSFAFTVTFSPTRAGYHPEQITVTDGSSNPSAQIAIAGVGVRRELLMVTPSSLSFGEVTIGEKAERPLVLKNNDSSDVTVRHFYTMSPGFFVTGPTVPFTLKPGQSTTLTVTFHPRAAGPAGSSVFVAGPSLGVPLTGTGGSAGKVSIAPAGLNFGAVDVGGTSKRVLTMSATGGSVLVYSASSSNAQFAIPGTTFPFTIDSGKSVDLDVVFSPTEKGTSSGELSFASDAANAESSEPLTGAGILPQYSVNLSWNPSASSVIGYNIYRGTAMGTYSKLNSALNAGTTYTDNTVVSGTTYYYVAKAVNAQGQESAYSAPLKVVIP